MIDNRNSTGVDPDSVEAVRDCFAFSSANETRAARGQNDQSVKVTEEPSRQDSWRILIVDDSTLALEATKQLLEITGHQVRTASTGAAAIRAAADFQPELLLLDISLPDMNGYEALRRLKGIKSLAKTLFVALTGYGEEERARAQQAGFDHFIMKPFDLETFDRLLATRKDASP